MNHFSKTIIRTLTKRGIIITGLTAIPDMTSDMPYANAQTGYVVNDKGTGRVWRFADVLKAAA